MNFISNPQKRSKLVCRYKGWKIYTNVSEMNYSAFLPGESPNTMDYPEWEDDSLEALKSFIDSY